MAVLLSAQLRSATYTTGANHQAPESEGINHGTSRLFPRKGGGGRGSSGRGSSSRGSSSGGKGGGSSSSGSSAAKSHGASSQFTSSRGAVSFSITKDSKTTASPYSEGGGKTITLGDDTSFPGRQAGGATRVCSIRVITMYRELYAYMSRLGRCVWDLKVRKWIFIRRLWELCRL